MENKILIHADINLNVVDGATIWWSNTINVFIQGGIDIIYISNYKITNDSNLRNIENKSKLTLINPDKNLNPTETLKKIEEYGNKVKSILLRSNLILAIINENWNLLSKTIIYGLDIHLNNIKKLNNKFKKVWTQSDKLKKLFETNGINKVKIVPVVAYKYDFNLPERNDNEIRLIYTGTLRDEENIIEIIEEFQKIHKERSEVFLKIVYGKIHGDSNFVNKINTYIKTGVKGITFKNNLSHKDTCYEIATSDIGICWRKNGWGNNGEVSTKAKEYKVYGLKILNSINLFNIEIFKDYINFKYISSENLSLLNIHYHNKIIENQLKLNINKRLKINYIIMNLPYINKLNGYVNNELMIMIFLTKIFDIYYNDNLINDCIENNSLNIKKLNDKIIKRINTSNKTNFYDNYYSIFKHTNDYDITYFRSDNTDYIKKLYKLIPGLKVFSHTYDYNMWNTEIIGFQTFISEYMAKNNILKYFKDDNTLNYNKITLIPKYSTVRPNFIEEHTIVKKKLDNNFNICVIGNINEENNILNELVIIIKNIILKTNKNIILYILSKDNISINETIIKNIYFENKNEYYNFLSSCDLAINTWISEVSLYSNSNKVFDCISCDVPIIIPHSFHLYDILGKNYPLYYRCHCYKYDIENSILLSLTTNIKYNIDIKQYNLNILNYYNKSILELKNKFILFGISSGKRYYGGIATNIDNYLTILKKYKYFNFDIDGIMYDNYIKEDKIYENGLIHTTSSNIYNHLIKLLNKNNYKKIVIILFSWIPNDIIEFFRKNNNIYIILCNPGLFIDDLNNFYLNSNNNNKLSDVQINTIRKVDHIFYNSQLSYNIASRYINNKNNKEVLYYNSPLYYYFTDWNKKIYDLGFIVSNTKRNIKNFNLFTKILNNMKSLRILIVGIDPLFNNDFYKKYSDFNIKYDFNITNNQSIYYISKTKILINTSFFDCGPTTLFESILCKSKYITSRNVGGIELLNQEEIVEDYNSVEEWSKTILKNLKYEPIRKKEILNKISYKNVIMKIINMINKV